MQEVAKRFKPSFAQMQIRSTNWRGLMYTLLIVSAKYHSDINFYSLNVADAMAKDFDHHYLNSSEHMILRLLDFKMFVTP